VTKDPTNVEYQGAGKTTIAPDVLLAVARLTTLNVPGVRRMGNVPVQAKNLITRSAAEGVHLNIKDEVVSADLYVILDHDVNIRDVSRQIQRNVARAVSEMVGMQIGRVNIHIEDIDYPLESEPEASHEA